MTSSPTDATTLTHRLQPLLTDLEAEIGEVRKHPAAAAIPFAGVEAALQRLTDGITAATAGVVAEMRRLADVINASASTELSTVDARTPGPRSGSAKPS